MRKGVSPLGTGITNSELRKTNRPKNNKEAKIALLEVIFELEGFEAMLFSS